MDIETFDSIHVGIATQKILNLETPNFHKQQLGEDIETLGSIVLGITIYEEKRSFVSIKESTQHP